MGRRAFTAITRSRASGGLARLRLPQRRWAVGVAALVVIAGAAIAITDPFAGNVPSGSGVADNQYPTSTTRIVRESIASQTSESATLGYAGSYTISLPTGVNASAVAQAQSSAKSAQMKVGDDEVALASARATTGPERASTLLAAKATVSNDETTLAAARAQLASDVALGCPTSSSATVTTPLSGSTPSEGSPASTGSPSSSPSTPTTTPSGTTPAGRDTSLIEDTAALEGEPIVTTGSASGTASNLVTLSGTVDPNGSDTVYRFEYGTSSAFGEETPTQLAGSGTSALEVSATITGLKPDTTYDFTIVATSALGTTIGQTVPFQTVGSSCSAERAVIATDTADVTEAKDALSEDELGGNSTVTQDEEQLQSDEASASAAQQALVIAQSQATNSSTTVTALPPSGKVITRGESVYSLDGKPVPLFYGAVTLYRSLYLGVSDGPDIAELQANLVALGFGAGITASDHFSAATEADVKEWQSSIGVPATGVVALGDVVLEPGPIEVDTISANTGAAASPGSPILTATSTNREVTIDLDADQQSEIKVGDPVTITLPDNSTTPGVVSSVGTVATTPSSSGGSTPGAGTPTITVEVTLTDPRAAGDLDQAPVEVSITNASVANALVVPVDALLALSSGGYALEVVGANGAHHLEAVSLGLFDDAEGSVQVSGPGVVAGQKIVVPNV
jgi:Putative peptidoglycan binding domain